MIKNFLLLTVRSMMKNKLFIAINVLGLGVAIAVCIVGFLAFQYDATFDSAHQQRHTLYRVSSLRDFEGTLSRFGIAPMALGEIVKRTLTDVDASSQYVHSSSNFKVGDDLFSSNLSYVDPDFFNMFSLDFIVGNKDDLKDKASLFISESMAVRLFNSPQDAFGKTITQVYGTALKELKIAGVYREPAPNSSFYRKEGSAFSSFENVKDEFPSLHEDSWQNETTLFVQINEASRVNVVHDRLQSFVPNNNKVRDDFHVAEFTLDPFSSMAHRDRDESVLSYTWAAPPSSAIIGSLIMGGLIVLIACFNLTNTAIAISSGRLKEIGIRKVMGGRRVQLISQFIAETTFICLLAMIVGIALADVLIAGWNLMTANNIHLAPDYMKSTEFIIFMLGLLLVTGLLAGSYPAFYISKFKPISILKGKLRLGGTNHFTRALLGAQFAISLIAIVSAIGFLQNARYQNNYDLGFDVRGSVIATVNDQTEFETYRNSLETSANILSVAGSQSSIFSNPLHEPVKYDSKQAEVDVIAVGDNYLTTMDIKLIAGRDFIKDSQTDHRESIIITQSMADLFGWADPLGKQLLWKDTTKLFVVGVVKNIYTQGLWREMQPMMMRYARPADYTQIVVSSKAENVDDVNAFMKEQWRMVFPNRLYNGYMLSETLQQVTSLNMSIVYGYCFLGIVALLLSATGLFSLLSLNIVKRTKEIGVRKVLGASVLSITRVVNTEFIITLGVASFLGCWMAYGWCNTLMSNIWKYYQPVNAATFTVAVTVMFIVALVVMVFKIVAMSKMNPIETLRDE